jgi:hypothetical protein
VVVVVVSDVVVVTVVIDTVEALVTTIPVVVKFGFVVAVL